MGEVKVHRMYLKVTCIERFTWLWSSPQFCTSSRESVQKGQRGKRSLAKLERRGRMEARKQLTGQRKKLSQIDLQIDMRTNITAFILHRKEKREVKLPRQRFIV